jgi:transposase-like protein
MSQPLEVVRAGSFCWNEQCPDHGIVAAGNLRRYGKTPAGVQRFQCKRCRKVFAASLGTSFYGIRNPERMLLVLRLLADRMSLRGIQRVTGVKPDLTLSYLARAAAHVEVIETLLQRSHKVSRVQLDALWAFVGHKGEKGGALMCSSLRRKGADDLTEKRTPAMAAGLTDRCWTVRHLLSMVVPPRRHQR